VFVLEVSENTGLAEPVSGCFDALERKKLIHPFKKDSATQGSATLFRTDV